MKEFPFKSSKKTLQKHVYLLHTIDLLYYKLFYGKPNIDSAV